ncbi:MAG: hypothetical protein J6I84_02725 [Bacilli bacterium]|nr:hypothetical protein [Bacilli bacterium]
MSFTLETDLDVIIYGACQVREVTRKFRVNKITPEMVESIKRVIPIYQDLKDREDFKATVKNFEGKLDILKKLGYKL